MYICLSIYFLSVCMSACLSYYLFPNPPLSLSLSSTLSLSLSLFLSLSLSLSYFLSIFINSFSFLFLLFLYLTLKSSMLQTTLDRMMHLRRDASTLPFRLLFLSLPLPYVRSLFLSLLLNLLSLSICLTLMSLLLQ